MGNEIIEIEWDVLEESFLQVIYLDNKNKWEHNRFKNVLTTENT